MQTLYSYREEALELFDELVSSYERSGEGLRQRLAMAMLCRAIALGGLERPRALQPPLIRSVNAVIAVACPENGGTVAPRRPPLAAA